MARELRQQPIFAYLRNLDYLQLGAVALLLGIGLVFIRSTGLQIDTETSRSFFDKQLMWIIVGFGVYFFVSALDYRSFSFRACMAGGYLLSLLLLVVVLFAGVRVFGATRWLNIFGFRKMFSCIVCFIA